MDNPSIGQQLFDTLSQGSGGSSSRASKTGGSSRGRGISEGGSVICGHASVASGLTSALSARADLSQNGDFRGHNNRRNQHNSLNQMHNRGAASIASGGGLSQASATSHVDEAYRRLGQRLSLQAHGNVSKSSPPSLVRLQAHRSSGFAPFNVERNTQQSQGMDASKPQQQLEKTLSRMFSDDSPLSIINGDGSESRVAARIAKVPKTGYADHGEHGISQPRSSNSLLRALIYEAKDRFRKWQDAEPPHPNKSASGKEKTASETSGRLEQMDSKNSVTDPSSISPQNYAAFSQLDLEGTKQSTAITNSASRQAPGVAHDKYPAELTWSQHQQQHRRNRHGSMGPPSSSKGLLSSVMEGHSDSCERSAQTSPSISTKDTRSAVSTTRDAATVGSNSYRQSPVSRQQLQQLHQLHQQQPPPPMIRGKCLTTPSEGITNNWADNADGNLILFENDVILVPPKSLHTISADLEHVDGRSAEFRIQSLLGQGTFAQVFQCLHVQSGSIVAIKVIKNKAAYTRQAAVEIDIFRALQEGGDGGAINGRSSTPATQTSKPGAKASSTDTRDYMVNLVCFFMHRSHLCLVFELLGLNLYEVLKKRQFRGLPLSVVQSIVHQAVVGVKDLAQKSIVHCDLKPENVLLLSDEDATIIVTAGETRRPPNSGESSSSKPMETSQSSSQSSGAVTAHASNTAESVKSWVDNPSSSRRNIKLIDFGSACFEGYTAHTYIQSRFYRSPEVLIGLPYDSAIDMWSLGCVAAELFLGLPILPGVHEHDQLGRITEMIGKVPDWMLDQGSKSTKYYGKFVPRPPPAMVNASPNTTPPLIRSPSPAIGPGSPGPTHSLPQWRLKTQKEYVSSLSPNEVQKKGGLAKLEKQPGNRYFKRKRLADILTLHFQSTASEDKELLPAFVHFLYGLLDPDPWKRWTAFQAIEHPFLTGDVGRLCPKTPEMKIDPKEENHANLQLGLFWPAPWDPAVCRRKLLSVQKMREKQQAMRRNKPSRHNGHGDTPVDMGLHSDSHRSRQGYQHTGTPMDESPLPTRFQAGDGFSPPNELAASNQSSAAVPLRGLINSDHEGSWGANLGIASSLTNLGRPGAHIPETFLKEAVAPHSIEHQDTASVSGVPKSFAGVSSNDAGRFLKEADFANALQRPGVIPGVGAMASPASPWINHDRTQQGQGSHVKLRREYVEMHQTCNSISGTQDTQPLTQTSLSYGIVSQGGTSISIQNYSASLGTQTFAQQMQPIIVTPNHPLNGNHLDGVPSSAASSMTMHGGSLPMMGSDAGFAYADQTQASFLQQQQLQQQIQQQQQQQQQQRQSLQFQMQQQQQQIGMQSMQSPAQYQTAQGQPLMQAHPQQFLPMQQPVIAGTPGGGYYYVATSAMGQPIVLQAVAVMDQQTNQMNQFGQQPVYQNMQMLVPQPYGHQGMPQILPGNGANPGQFDQVTMSQQPFQQPWQPYQQAMPQQQPPMSRGNSRRTGM